jgi:excinuclease ABC subunit A
MVQQWITLRGATEHNLAGVDLDLPHGQCIAFSGVSGSGKTSLVFDTLYAEARRRFLVVMDRSDQGLARRVRPPRVQLLEGLAPAVAIAQHARGVGPRSTVATLTGVHDFLRLLWTRIGVAHCLSCGAAVRCQRAEELYDAAASLPAGTSLTILAPRWLSPDEDVAAFLAWTDRAGYRRIRAGTTYWTLEDADPERLQGQPMAVVIDRLLIRPDTHRRLRGSLEAAAEVGQGRVCLVDAATGGEQTFAVRPVCSACGAPSRPLEPALFSFQSRRGACPICRGLGVERTVHQEQVMGGEHGTLEDCLGPLWRDFGQQELQRQLARLCRRHGIDMDQPVGTWPEAAVAEFWHGRASGFAGMASWLQNPPARSPAQLRVWLEAFAGHTACAACGGTRLRPEALAVTVAGQHLAHLCAQPLASLPDFLDGLRAPGLEQAVIDLLAVHLRRSVTVLCDLGLGYLTWDRPAETLSSGELQRLRLAAALGARMTQVLYVLDEPSLGLHARDTERLVSALMALRDDGNTVVVVEHDLAVLRRADLLVDVGPGAGPGGGTIVALGPPAAVAAGDSLTGQYLSGRRQLPDRPRRPVGQVGWLTIHEARGHNLKGVTAAFPLGALTCVTGVSGSGKSSLVQGTLWPALAARLHRSSLAALPHGGCTGADGLQRVVAVDQRPVGRTPRSHAASYTGLLTPLRRLFAALPEARLRAYKPAHFSFNAPEGACPQCGGSGAQPTRQGWLDTADLVCGACSGSRYNREVLEIRYRGLTIAQVLELTVGEALERFGAVPDLASRLLLLQSVGLGYLRLGQPSPQLSGGEAQRVKLAADLGRPSVGATVYLLDEPTTGLHLEDVRLLLELLRRLVDQGSTVVVVEHHLEFAAAADWVIDLGPEAGEAGGQVVAAGAPAEVAAAPASITGRFLAQHLRAGSVTPVPAALSTTR